MSICNVQIIFRNRNKRHLSHANRLPQLGKPRHHRPQYYLGAQYPRGPVRPPVGPRLGPDREQTREGPDARHLRPENEFADRLAKGEEQNGLQNRALSCGHHRRRDVRQLRQRLRVHRRRQQPRAHRVQPARSRIPPHHPQLLQLRPAGRRPARRRSPLPDAVRHLQSGTVADRQGRPPNTLLQLASQHQSVRRVYSRHTEQVPGHDTQFLRVQSDGLEGHERAVGSIDLRRGNRRAILHADHETRNCLLEFVRVRVDYRI